MHDSKTGEITLTSDQWQLAVHTHQWGPAAAATLVPQEARHGPKASTLPLLHPSTKYADSHEVTWHERQQCIWGHHIWQHCIASSYAEVVCRGHRGNQPSHVSWSPYGSVRPFRKSSVSSYVMHQYLTAWRCNIQRM
ncbi:hypothetical protein ABBQ38_000772 [Trebouxia sp. C0009 RCD-2024]